MATPLSDSTLRLLLVEDSENDALLLVRHLERGGYRVACTRVDTRAAFIDAATGAEWDLIISDHSMPHFSSTDALSEVTAREIDCPFIIVSGTIGEETAVESMRAGAHDYVLKNNLSRLLPAIARSLEEAATRRQARVERNARQAMERQLQQSQRMEAIGRLAGGIAHDFNNLLTVILGFSELALERMQAAADVRFEVDQVKLAAERAALLTRQLVAFSRQQVLAPRLVDPAVAIEQLLPMLSRLLGPSIQVHFAGQPGAGRIRVDAGQLEQVILNLAINARDAMPNGGRLRIRSAAVDLDSVTARRLELDPGSYIRLETADSGVGMDDDTRTRIFEPFFTTKALGEGTGLGLSTVYGIVKQSGGAIDVTSTPGEGTSFLIYLPTATSAEDRPQGRVPARHAHHIVRGTVLVVEPEDAVRTLVRTVLTSVGFQVYESPSGNDAVERLRALSEPLTLLLTETVLPGAGVSDVVRAARDRFPLVPVLYLGSPVPLAAVAPIDREAARAILEKPFVPDHLLTRVYQRLGLAV